MSTANKTVISLNEAVRKQIELKFRNIHALIKNNRPISDLTWLNELDIAKDCDDGKTTQLQLQIFFRVYF